MQNVNTYKHTYIHKHTHTHTHTSTHPHTHPPTHTSTRLHTHILRRRRTLPTFAERLLPTQTTFRTDSQFSADVATGALLTC